MVEKSKVIGIMLQHSDGDYRRREAGMVDRCGF